MGNTQSIQKISFEDIQTAIKNPESYLLINTLPLSEQRCLIKNTCNAEKEIEIINKYMNKYNKNIKIIIYGKNSNDYTAQKKYEQLISLGFYNIYIYLGGMFEWLLLQDIYGQEEFPTTSKELDILKYKPNSTLNVCLLE
jgi:Rhodanese-like domain